MANQSVVIENIKSNAEETAQEVVTNPWLEKLTRFGYAMRGFLYIIVGILAVGVATGRGGPMPDQTGALEVLGSHTLGKVLLGFLAVGLVGYALWGFVRALLDPMGRGTSLRGIAERIGYVVSGLTYGGLVLPTARLVLGAGSGDDTGGQDWLAWLLTQTVGPWVVVLVGLIGMGGGLGQLYMAFRASFVKDFKTEEMSAGALRVATYLGQFGMWARGIVFMLLGLFLIRSGWQSDASEAIGLDGALGQLAQESYGPWFLILVAIGLAAFGIFSLLSARWINICPVPDAGSKVTVSADGKSLKP